MAVELELGATEDPRALVLGDPDALAATGRHITDLAAAFGRTADGLTRIGTGRWRGQAADAFRARFPDVTGDWTRAGAAFASAARGWDDYRGAVTWAQDQAVEAIRQYRAGVAASVAAVAARAEVEARHDAESRAFAAGRGPAPAPLGPFTDPGPAVVAAARAVLDAARRRRDEVAGGVAATLAAVTATAPEMPAFPDALLADAQDGWGAMIDDAGRAAAGFVDGVEGLVRTVRAVNPFDPWAATHPASVVAGFSDAAAGAVDATVHPLRLLGTGWADDPARATGRLAPTVLAAVATGGAEPGAAMTAERAAVRPAALPRPIEPAAVPGPGIVGPRSLPPSARLAEPAAVPGPEIKAPRTGSLPPTAPRAGRAGAPGPAAGHSPGPVGRPAPPGADSPTGRVVVRLPRRPDPPDPPRPGPARPDHDPHPLSPGADAASTVDPGPKAHAHPTPPTPAGSPPPAADDRGPRPTREPRPPGRANGPSLGEADAAAAERFRDIPTPAGRTIPEGPGVVSPRPPLPPTEIQFREPVPRIAAGLPTGPAPAHPAAPIRDAGGHPRVPAGFADEEAFQRFGQEIRDGLAAAGHDDVRIYFAGSAVSGVSFKAGVPFDTGRVSDYDIALASRALLRRAKAAGVEVRGHGARTAPLTLDQADRLGIGDLQRRLSAEAGRPVYFMIYASDGAVQARAATIEVVPR